MLDSNPGAGRGSGSKWARSVAGLVATVISVFTVGAAGAEEIATYVFETTRTGGPGEHCQARVEFSFYRRAGDRELTADEIIDGYAVFESDQGVLAAIDLAFDDAGFGPIAIAPDGTLRIDGLRSTATLGTLRIVGDPTLTLGPGGGRVGLDRRSGCRFYGVWSSSVLQTLETRLAETPFQPLPPTFAEPEEASSRGLAILAGLGLLGGIGRHRRWRARRRWRSA